MARRSAIVLAVAGLLVPLTGLVLGAQPAFAAAPGSLDTTFNPTTGFVQTSFGNNAFSRAVDHNATLIAQVGRVDDATSGHVLVATSVYDADGAPDTGFDSDGQVIQQVGTATADDDPIGVTIDSGGKVTVGGSWFDGTGNPRVFLVRRTSTGALDTTFNTTGIQSDDLGFGLGVAAMAVQADGKILLAGTDTDTSQMFVVRYNTNGTRDTAFGTNGIAETVFPQSATANDVGVARSNEDIVLVGATGATNTDAAFARFTPAGVLDTTFGPSGMRTFDSGSTDESAFGVAQQPSGLNTDQLIVGITSTTEGVTLARLNEADGSLDTTFGEQAPGGPGPGGTHTGVLHTGFTTDPTADGPSRVVVAPDNKIIVAGTIDDGTNPRDIAVLRAIANGSQLDSGFGTAGVARIDLGGDDFGLGLSLMNDRILVSGGTDNGSAPDHQVVVAAVQTDTAAVEYSINDVSVTEGDSGTTPATFTVSASFPVPGGGATLHYDTVDDTATAPSDYAATVNGSVVFAAGDTTQTITVPVNGDTSHEGDETFSVVLSNGGTFADDTGVGTIVDDDPFASIADGFGFEGDSGTSNMTFTVTLDSAPSAPGTVDFATTAGTATAGVDYTTTTGTLSFAAGDTTKSINVPIHGDQTTEPNETFSVTLSNPTGSISGVGTATATGTIVDDDNAGYWLAARDGGVFNFGSAQFHGSTGNLHLNAPIVGIAGNPFGTGYWLVASDGGIFNFGDAPFKGSTGNLHLNKPIVGMAATPDGQGYWLVASDGGIFSFGDATFHGSMGGTHLNQPVVGMAATPDGAGYWMVASDGGIFSFGTAIFHGSMGGAHLNKPIVGMAATFDGAGYWMVASDGGIFNFGDAGFKGSTGNLHLNAPIVGMAANLNGEGYWLAASDGGVFNFGDAPFRGSMGGAHLNQPIVAMAAPGLGPQSG